MKETEHLLIRKFGENDLQDVQRILGDPELMFYSGISPFSIEQSKKWLLNHISCYSESDSLGVFALELKDSGEVIGYCGLEALPESIAQAVEAVVGIEHEHWGKGYATETVTSMLEYAFNECRLDRVAAVVHRENEAALHLVMRCGFEQKQELTVEGVGPHFLFSLEAPNPLPDRQSRGRGSPV